MKIVILNGSPRKGNTVTAINALKQGIKAEHEVEVIDTYKLKIGPCKGCGACGCQSGCVDKDDTNPTIDKLVAADLIVFASPVYWWGITAQMKLVLDKCYCRGQKLLKKKVGLIIPGGSPIDEEQYRLIKRQFDCIAEYLGWEILFYEPIYANKKDDLEKDTAELEKLVQLGETIG